MCIWFVCNHKGIKASQLQQKLGNFQAVVTEILDGLLGNAPPKPSQDIIHLKTRNLKDGNLDLPFFFFWGFMISTIFI